jgi:hypothetical protein
VGFFGTPAFDPRYQKEIDAEQELFDRWNKAADDDSEDSAP